MTKDCYSSVDASKTLPTTKGYYITNFGELPFNGKTFGFRQKTSHENFNNQPFTPTVVDWWFNQEDKVPIIKV